MYVAVVIFASIVLMPDAQNFSYKVLAVTFVKSPTSILQKKAFGALLSDTISSCAFGGRGRCGHFNSFPIQPFVEKNGKNVQGKFPQCQFHE